MRGVIHTIAVHHFEPCPQWPGILQCKDSAELINNHKYFRDASKHLDIYL